MKWWILLFLPVIVWAQDFPFEQEIDAIPLTIEGRDVPIPWFFGMSYSNPSFGDFDVDGDYDLLVGNFSGDLFYFLNIGTVNEALFEWLDQQIIPFDSLDAWVCPEFCDLDADGDEDLLLADNSGVVRYFQNQSSAGQIIFVFAGDSLNGTDIVSWISTIDINGDGDYDLFAGAYYGNIYYFENDGTPQTYNYSLVTSNFESIDVGYFANPTFCDLDADNDYDLFIGNSNGNIWYYENTGDSINWNFGIPVINWLGIDVGEYASPEFCDINDDGDFDLFVGREPTGNFQTMGDVFFYENIGNSQIPNFEYVTSNYLTVDIGDHTRQQLMDIDADGDLDLFVGAGDEIRFFRNTGDSANPAYSLAEEYFQGISLESIMPYFCDIDADGDYDLFAGEGIIPGPPLLHLYLNEGTIYQPLFNHYTDRVIYGEYSVLVSPALADIDSDGDFDLFLTDNGSTGDIYYYENNGSPSWPVFEDSIPNWQGIEIESGLQRQLRFYDIDDDGDLDLFFENNWNETEGANLRFYQNNGTFQNPNMELITHAYLPLEVHYPCAWFCNIDGDDYMDIFVGEMNGGILFFHGVPSSEVGPRRPYVPYPKLDFSIGPNPANPVTWISFSLPAPQEATLAVYNILGAKVTTLTSGLQMPGTHNIIWNASQYSSGVYIIRLETPQNTFSQRVMIVK